MSKSKPPKKVVVPTTKTPTPPSTNTNRPTPTTSSRTTSSRTTTARTRQTVTAPKGELIFSGQNYIWMGIGIGLITIGLFLMSGGKMPSPDVWEADRIYSFRRITLAPIFIIAGLLVEIYGIFKKNDAAKEQAAKKELV